MPGFEDWVEIFKGGKQTDSNGREHDADVLIEKAVRNFNATEHEPPAVIGHPKTNAPAYGWVADVKAETVKGVNTLFAKFRDVVPEFADMVKQKMFKKRSASFYGDGRLRHVGFLGAAPPAVKGLADMQFGEEDPGITFEFYDYGMDTISRMLRRLRDWLIEKEGKETADNVLPDWDLDYLRDMANKPEIKETEEVNMGFQDGKGTSTAQFSEDELNARIEEAAKKAREEALAEARKAVEAEFAEKEVEKQRESLKKEVSEWCDRMVSEGKMTPAWVKYGLPDIFSFMAAEDHDVIEFGEAKSKDLPVKRLMDFFEKEMPKVVNFNEIATRDKDVNAGSATQKLEALINRKMKETDGMDYSTAFAEVQSEHPALNQEYMIELNQRA